MPYSIADLVHEIRTLTQQVHTSDLQLASHRQQLSTCQTQLQKVTAQQSHTQQTVHTLHR